jgi:hypothetical protein
MGEASAAAVSAAADPLVRIDETAAGAAVAGARR